MKLLDRSLLASFRNVVLAAAVITPLACAGNAGKVAAGPAGSAPGASGIDYTGQMACVDGARHFGSPLSLKMVERCMFVGGSVNRLDLQFQHDALVSRDSTIAKINGFKGVGSYATTASGSDTDTFVNVVGYNEALESDGTHGGATGLSGGAADCRGGCTLTITDASVTSAAIGEKGRLAGSIDCSSLAGAGVGCVKCTMAPSKMDFDIAACEHAE